jgi:hypothetical protein
MSKPRKPRQIKKRKLKLARRPVSKSKRKSIWNVGYKNQRQSIWHIKTDNFDRYYLVSTSIDHSEVMIFTCDRNGKVENWLEVYRNCTHDVFDHIYHIKGYYKIITQ